MGIFYCDGCDCYRDADIDNFYETVGDDGLIETRCDRCIEEINLDDMSVDLYNSISELYQGVDDEEN